MPSPRPRLTPVFPTLALLIFGSLCGAAETQAWPQPAGERVHAQVQVPEPTILHIAASVLGLCLLLRRR